MTDIGQDIVIGKEIAFSELQDKVEELEGRLSIIEIVGNMAHIKYRNYFKDANKDRVMDENGAYELLPIIDKWVSIT